MFLGPQRICVAPRAGCAEILGRRSRVSTEAVVVVEGEETAEDLILKVEGNTVGREGPRKDVNVLIRVRCWLSHAVVLFPTSSK